MKKTKEKKINYSEMLESSAQTISNVYLFILLSIIFAPIMLVFQITIIIRNFYIYKKNKKILLSNFEGVT